MLGRCNGTIPLFRNDLYCHYRPSKWTQIAQDGPNWPFCHQKLVWWLWTCGIDWIKGGSVLSPPLEHSGNVMEPFHRSGMAIKGCYNAPKWPFMVSYGFFEPFWDIFGVFRPPNLHSWPGKWFHDIAWVCFDLFQPCYTSLDPQDRLMATKWHFWPFGATLRAYDAPIVTSAMHYR